MCPVVKPVAGRQIVGVCAIDVLKAGGKVLANKIRFVTRADGGITAFAIGKDIYRLGLPANGR